MATTEDKQWWDPYETSHKRQFVYRPAAEILVCPTSTSFIDSSSQSGPIGSTLYNKDFCWKPPCKPECIRTGTASGQRRNNPHPSQSFMKWRLPRDAARSSEYVGFPWKCPPSEGEIRKALTAQYSSIYRCDYMRHDHLIDGERRPAPRHSRPEKILSTDTEMRDNYRQPKQKLELLGNSSLYSCPHPNVTCRGIVPTVVQRHTQQKTSYLTNYDQFCGKKLSNVTNMIKSLLPQELQQLHTTSPKEEKEAVKTVMSINAYPNNREKVNELPPVVLDSCSPKWISSWPGPL
ncbi:testis-expressed protein 26-like isoform X2 [Pseudoliparis swirei]|uniref:testis-expressed protein 26-like isoform X2 n=1 Tax=Pseudoliparis swirei TaxID=2059687 RepID=UPI0024BEA135|nr:testis-expressed protein 26-like isoform X2 [Pseudoliparis swirei]